MYIVILDMFCNGIKVAYIPHKHQIHCIWTWNRSITAGQSFSSIYLLIWEISFVHIYCADTNVYVDVVLRVIKYCIKLTMSQYHVKIGSKSDLHLSGTSIGWLQETVCTRMTLVISKVVIQAICGLLDVQQQHQLKLTYFYG